MKAFSVVTICVFGIVFSLFLTITGAFRELPLGGTFFSGIQACIINGVFYGIIGALIYAIACFLRGSKLESKVRIESKKENVLEVPIIEDAKTNVPKEINGESKEGVPILYVEGIGNVYAKKT
jgi:hypothetical protein